MVAEVQTEALIEALDATIHSIKVRSTFREVTASYARSEIIMWLLLKWQQLQD